MAPPAPSFVNASSMLPTWRAQPQSAVGAVPNPVPGWRASLAPLQASAWHAAPLLHPTPVELSRPVPQPPVVAWMERVQAAARSRAMGFEGPH